MPPSKDDPSPTTHISRLADLITLERDHEISSTQAQLAQLTPSALQKRGLCLLGLRITGSRTGLGGKLLVDFEGPQEALPAHLFRVGDVVGVCEYVKSGRKEKEESGEDVVGVVFRVEEGRICVAIKEDRPGGLEGRVWRINKLANNVTYKRMEDALKALQDTISTPRSTALHQVLLGQRSPTFAESVNVIDFFNDRLNESQKEAVRFAQSANEIALVHGPPGTGKTETVVEIVRQFVKDGKRVLVCGPSNISVDNIVERLSSARLPMVRIGHPARVLPTVLDSTLDIQLRNSDAAGLVSDIRKEIDANLKQMSKTRNKGEKKAMWQQNRDLRKELKQREKNALRNLIDTAKIVLCTLNGAGSKNVRKAKPFDVVVVDEATQALEAETWIALLLAPKAILAGDHKQLPPTVKSPKAVKNGLEKTLFDRLLEIHGDSIKRLLNTQYRMHDSIMQWSSSAMYSNLLQSHPSVRTRVLSDLSHVESTEDTRSPLVFIDTAGCDMWESVAEDGETRYNEGEARIVDAYVASLVRSGVRAEEIAVITPYNGQVDLIRTLLKSKYVGMEVGSVDGFQGREKEAIILSLVRSNGEGQVGFLSEERRLNVAITRAKRHVCLVGDSETVERGGKFLKKMIEWFTEQGELLPANAFDGVVQ
ncbi:uncharacterized protein SPPG_05763 [Spizellomyces punctatus DAOM BR117]|uniref:DNA helicase n=1 Tax=Spizellomyces punctatus (strain DAOM BR117) TaxID=645134 RepID=A0A0L0HCS9_SPIPD|nr:uncharacterized protein SPPG_05763 [Spizellomyces punctatus DAOM BR117]KNC98786.1 hypothetical protein SPPG_05763 [Spizellomyces punctatus DAOM BR117]|eukprot:XP_016606826.1 hypothetical protein SPPG_05763 [Spizellomyces punctatus DAOM BR117]